MAEHSAPAGPQHDRLDLVKNRGVTVRRDTVGAWHTYRPDGSEIC